MRKSKEMKWVCATIAAASGLILILILTSFIAASMSASNRNQTGPEIEAAAEPEVIYRTKVEYVEVPAECEHDGLNEDICDVRLYTMYYAGDMRVVFDLESDEGFTLDETDANWFDDDYQIKWSYGDELDVVVCHDYVWATFQR